MLPLCIDHYIEWKLSDVANMIFGQIQLIHNMMVAKFLSTMEYINNHPK